jgi:uncharacterized membrane protein YfcA
MLDVLMGIVLGFLAGLGVGGGSLLILWLTLVVGISQPEARWINLAFFITAAGAVSLLRWKQGQLEIKKLLPAIIAGSIGAAATALFRNMIDPAVLKKAFGILLLITGVRELCYRPRNAK